MISKIKNKILWILQGKYKRKRYLSKNDFSFGEQNIVNYQRPFVDKEQGNKKIFELLQSDKPVMIARLGSVELRVVHSYLLISTKLLQDYDEYTRTEILNSAGFFPVNYKTLEKFSRLYIKEIKNVDLLGIWFKEGEDVVCNNFTKKNIVLTPLQALEPYYYEKPWSAVLENKKVLVIHPFENSIRKQYEKRHLLFSNKSILPTFELLTLKVPLTHGGISNYENWFVVLNELKSKIDRIDFDIAIIGAGAYGLPLAAHIKRIGKKAVHMGGATQILFGIKGRRWEQIEFFQNLFNSEWVRPSKEETPPNSLEVDNACYW